MTDYEIFKKAAELIETKKADYACFAINEAMNMRYGRNTRLTKLFNDVLNDSGLAAFYSMTSAGEEDVDFSTGTELGKSARAIGLLLMAELVKENNPVLRSKR